MADRPMRLRPHDVVVALQLSLTPGETFAELARRTGLSVGEAHNAVKRLEATKLLTRKGRRPHRRTLVDFLVHGLPIVFPGHLGAEAPGVPTAHSGPDLRDDLVFDDEIVWPSAEGDVRGHSLIPLAPRAADLRSENPLLYRLLCLVDALRVGGARERRMATAALEEQLKDAEREASEP